MIQAILGSNKNCQFGNKIYGWVSTTWSKIGGKGDTAWALVYYLIRLCDKVLETGNHNAC